MKNNKKKQEEFDIKGLVITFGVLLVVVLIIYLLTLGAQKIGLFDEGYYKPEIKTPVISYDKILSGTIFNREESEYYVIIFDSSKDSNIYYDGIISLYNQKEDHLKVYAVDLSNDMNKNIIGDNSNSGVQSVNDLSVKDGTLIKISNGVNTRYVEGEEAIKSEFGISD